MTKNKVLFIASLSLALAVMLGAWNAHGMENFVDRGQMDAKYLKSFHTGVEYQFIHSIALLVLGFFVETESKPFRWGIGLLLTGMCLFSFSLYLLSFHEMLGEGLKRLGMVTPFGGLCMIAGWLVLAFAFIKKKP